MLSWTFSTSAQATALTYGEPATADVTAEANRFRYTFSGAAGDTVYASVFVPNANMDITLNLFGPNGTQLGSATDNVIGTLVGPLTLASAGTYTIEVFQPDYNVGEVGPIEVLVDNAELTAIKPDGSYSGRLERAGSVVFFAYTGPANELFGYTASGQQIGFFMYAPSGNQVLTNYSDDGLFEPLRILPEAGQHIGYLQTANPDGTDYTLSLNPINVVELQADAPVEGFLEAGRTQVFRFASPVDALWRIDVIAPDSAYSARMDVRAVNDPLSNLISDSSSGSDNAPRIDPFISPAAGEYYVLLSGAVDFDYTLTLTASLSTRLEQGTAQQATITTEMGIVTYLYFGIADEKIRLTLDVSAGQPSLVMLSPEDELITLLVRSPGRSTVEVVLPQTALYRIMLRTVSYDGSALDVGVMVEAAQ
jgi:hypothetical protein